jgi:calcium-dependent protein kinase
VYNIGKKLGSGAYAEVRFCSHRQNKASRAVKIIAKQLLESESAKNQFIKEIEILKLLDHPNIIRVFEFFEDENNFYIVMEHCKGGELFDEIIKHKNFNEYQAAHIIRLV